MLATSLVTPTVVILAPGSFIILTNLVDDATSNINALDLAVSDKKIFHVFEQTW